MTYLRGCGRSTRCWNQGKGWVYEYYVCLARIIKGDHCDLPYLPLPLAETAVENLWQAEQLPQAAIQALETITRDALDSLADEQQAEARHLDQRIADVKAERVLWARKALTDAIPADVAASEQERLVEELRQLECLRAGLVTADIAHHEAVQLVLNLLSQGPAAYLRVNDQSRRVFNHAWFHAIELDDLAGQVTISEATRAEPFAGIHQAAVQANLEPDANQPNRYGMWTAPNQPGAPLRAPVA